MLLTAIRRINPVAPKRAIRPGRAEAIVASWSETATGIDETASGCSSRRSARIRSSSACASATGTPGRSLATIGRNQLLRFSRRGSVSMTQGTIAWNVSCNGPPIGAATPMTV